MLVIDLIDGIPGGGPYRMAPPSRQAPVSALAASRIGWPLGRGGSGADGWPQVGKAREAHGKFSVVVLDETRTSSAVLFCLFVSIQAS